MHEGHDGLPQPDLLPRQDSPPGDYDKLSHHAHLGEQGLVFSLRWAHDALLLKTRERGQKIGN